jgi:hypothetical protein
MGSRTLELTLGYRLSILEESIKKANLRLVECQTCQSAVVPVPVHGPNDAYYFKCPVCNNAI